MGVLWIVIVGVLAGSAAKMLLPGNRPGGIVVTILLGLGGAFIGGYTGKALGFYGSPADTGGILMAALGAVLVLGIFGFVLSGRGRSPAARS